jgi:hypothetical protein
VSNEKRHQRVNQVGGFYTLSVPGCVRVKMNTQKSLRLPSYVDVGLDRPSLSNFGMKQVVTNTNPLGIQMNMTQAPYGGPTGDRTATRSYVITPKCSKTYLELGIHPEIGEAMFIDCNSTDRNGRVALYPIHVVNQMLRDEAGANPPAPAGNAADARRRVLSEGNVPNNLKNTDVMLHPSVINDRWAFIGFFMASTSPPGLTRPVSRTRNYVDVFDVGISGTLRQVVDYWGSRPSRTAMYFILKKQNGVYQYTPYADGFDGAKTALPPYGLLYDATIEDLQRPILACSVHSGSLSGSGMNQQSSLQAAGIGAMPKKAQAAAGHSAKIRVNVRM